MATLRHYLSVYFCITFFQRDIRSSLQISPHDIEYAVTRIGQRQRAVYFKSHPYFTHVTEISTKPLIFTTGLKSCIKQQKHQPQHNVEDMPQNVAHNEEEVHRGGDGAEIYQAQQYNQHEKDNFKKVVAAQSSTLSKQHEMKPKDVADEMQEPQHQQQRGEVEAKPIKEYGVNQPHNHQNQQHLTVNQTKVKQQLSQHHFKLLNVVNRRNKRQTPAVNSNNNNNKGNQQQQQYSTITIQYYPYQQQQQHTLPLPFIPYQLQEQQSQQQYQLHYYQPSQSRYLQNYNSNKKIELIVNGNSSSTFSQSTAAPLKKVTFIQQQQPSTLTLPLPPALATSIPTPAAKFPTLTTTLISPAPLSPITSTTQNYFKSFLPLEIINEYSNDPTTPPPPSVCKDCCIQNEFPCSRCCDGKPLLNDQTLKTLGG